MSGYNRLCGMLDEQRARLLPAFIPFGDRPVAFLADVSSALLANREARAYPDVVTFAYFCRRAHLARLKASYDVSGRIGRGLTFHIAPGNVPINFAYSLVAALLAGNACLVKAPSREFAQTRLVCEAIQNNLSGQNAVLRDYIGVITYAREQQEITARLSALCDIRLIWGGDETVRRVREAPLSPHAFDVTFPDRYSLLILRPQAVIALDDGELETMAQGFYNDAFLNDQNACTAPRLLYWLRTREPAILRLAQERFWNAVHAYAASRYPILPVVAVDKLTALYAAAVELPGAERVAMPDNRITRVRVGELTEALLDFRCAGGFFVEYEGEGMEALSVIAGRKAQTVAYLGADPEEIRAFVLTKGLRGVDRVVPLGKTLDFSLTWDGNDLIRLLSRHVTIQHP